MRIILYLGKGGVGKTTISAATAVRSAQPRRLFECSPDLRPQRIDDQPVGARSERD